MLLQITNCPFPRNLDKETPYDLAHKYGRNNCVKCLEKWELPDSVSSIKYWFHSELDREGCTKLFELFGLKDGLFLIRKSTKGEGLYVLSLCHNMNAMNYVIKNKTYLNKTVYFIDDGPYLLSLSHLIYYYNRTADGLPCTLITAVTTNNELDEVPHEDDYYYLPTPVVPNTAKTAKYRPNLPPRIEPTAPPASGDLYSQPQKNQNAPPSRSTSQTIPSTPTSPIDGPKLPESAPPSKAQEVQQEILNIKEKNIKLGTLLGEGEYGSVLKASLTIHEKHAIFPRSKKIDVAVKTFHEGSVDDEEDFLREAYVMQSLDHPCITKLLGVCHGAKQIMLVQEFVAMGSMLDYLIDHPDEIEIEKHLCPWAKQIAEGMAYLELKKLVHRDLAARNILLASKDQIKISDFGLSRATGSDNDYYRASKGGRWPIKWYAPESVNYGKFTHASDVWSYGVTLWEMFSFGDSPYGDKKGIEVIQYIEKGHRLKCPDKCPDFVYLMMKECWKGEPSKRPKFSALIEKFSAQLHSAPGRDSVKT